MKRIVLQLAAVGLLLGIPAARAEAALITFTANLDGLQEVPPNASPGTGVATVVLDDILKTITVDLTFQGLLAPTVAAHIHGPAPVGVNAPVIFPLALGGASGQTSGTIATQTFAITDPQIADLQNGLHYVNVHTQLLPGGEIRGQLFEDVTAAVPEPASLSLLGLGAVGLCGYAWRRRKQVA